MSGEADLAAVLDEAWALLAAGVRGRKHGFRYPVVAVGGAGPIAATVTLRGADRARRAIWFHADARGAKPGAIRAHSRLSWVFYDPESAVQVRAAGETSVHQGDARARAGWTASAPFSRRAYLAPEPPGSPSAGPTSGLPEDLRGRAPGEAEAEAGFANFALVETVVDALDWLGLDRAGNLRAGFRWSGGRFAGTWLTP